MHLSASRSLASLAVTSLLLGLPLACASEPKTCPEASCDPASEYCRLFGSDVLFEPPEATCVALPTACAAEPSCDCLLANELDIATCQETGAGFQVTIPAG